MGWLRRLFGGGSTAGKDKSAPRPSASASPTRTRPARNGGRTPARPAGQRFECWGPTPVSVEIAGESYVEDSFRVIFKDQREFRQDSGCEIRDDAVLAPDPRNPYDRNAIAVYVRDQHVGYIPRDTAKVWHPTLATLASEGRALHTQARTWARADGRRVYARATVRLPQRFDHLYPANPFPPGQLLPLPPGNRFQVTKEEPHQEHLRELLSRHGSGTYLAAVLVPAERVTRSGTKHVLEVFIDGAPVGELTPTTSAKHLPIVTDAHRNGMTVVVRAELDDAKGKVDVKLDVKRPDQDRQDHEGEST